MTKFRFTGKSSDEKKPTKNTNITYYFFLEKLYLCLDNVLVFTTQKLKEIKYTKIMIKLLSVPKTDLRPVQSASSSQVNSGSLPFIQNGDLKIIHSIGSSILQNNSSSTHQYNSAKH